MRTNRHDEAAPGKLIHVSLEIVIQPDILTEDRVNISSFSKKLSSRKTNTPVSLSAMTGAENFLHEV
jgi:hypothetical protein